MEALEIIKDINLYNDNDQQISNELKNMLICIGCKNQSNDQLLHPMQAAMFQCLTELPDEIRPSLFKVKARNNEIIMTLEHQNNNYSMLSKLKNEYKQKDRFETVLFGSIDDGINNAEDYESKVIEQPPNQYNAHFNYNTDDYQYSSDADQESGNDTYLEDDDISLIKGINTKKSKKDAQQIKMERQQRKKRIKERVEDSDQNRKSYPKSEQVKIISKSARNQKTKKLRHCLFFFKLTSTSTVFFSVLTPSLLHCFYTYNIVIVPTATIKSGHIFSIKINGNKIHRIANESNE